MLLNKSCDKMKILKLIGALCLLLMLCCASDNNVKPEPTPGDTTDVIVDDPNAIYPSYNKLVMAGYQGWHAAEGDDSDRGWYHYQKNGCGFFPGCTNVDLWPDMTEYE